MSGDAADDDYVQAIDLTLTAGEDRRTERLGVYEQHGNWIAWVG